MSPLLSPQCTGFPPSPLLPPPPCSSRTPPQPTCSKSARLPLIGCLSPALICHPEERQRIIYLEKRKTLKVSASDRHDTLSTGVKQQVQGAGFSSPRGLSPATQYPLPGSPLHPQMLSKIPQAWPFGDFPLRRLPISAGGCND